MPRMCYRLPHPRCRPPFAIRCDPGGCDGASGLQQEGAMITPIIHRVLTRADLDRLVAEIGRVDRAEARAAEDAVQTGDADAVPDSPAAPEAVRGRVGGRAAAWCAHMSRSPARRSRSPPAFSLPAGPWPPCVLVRPTRPMRCTRRWRKRGATT